MPWARLFRVVWQNIKRNRKNFAFSAFGIFVGISTLVFFLALGQGINLRVIGKMFPEDLIEIVPRRFKVAQTQLQFGGIDDDTIDELVKLPEIRRAFPKLRSKFQARVWGGGGRLLGRGNRDLHGEAFFDGIAASLIRPELKLQHKRKPDSTEGKPCKGHSDCRGEGLYCDWKNICAPFWSRFRDWETISCKADGECPFGRKCEKEICAAQPCTTTDPWRDKRGTCPRRTYCGVDRLTMSTIPARPGASRKTRSAYVGKCMAYIPVVVSPYLFELFNTIAAPTLGIPRIDRAAAFGIRGGLHFGASYMKSDLARKYQTLRRMEMVGFSTKAMDIGVTMPLPYVRRFNALYKKQIGAERLRLYDSVVIELANKKALPTLVPKVEKMEFTLSAKSKQGAEIRNFLFIVILVFGLISVLILLISAVNITHTFMMIVSERKLEIGILRSIGATKGDIRKIILTEASAVGILGGSAGCLFGWSISRLCNFLFTKYIPYFPYKPDNFFQFEPLLIGGAIGFAVLFCVFGAFLPANRASGLDPATALRVH